MSIKDKYKVLPIPKQQTHEWLLKKHYAKRLPMAIEYSYGLYSEHLQGVCVFGRVVVIWINHIYLVSRAIASNPA